MLPDFMGEKKDTRIHPLNWTNDFQKETIGEIFFYYPTMLVY